jgi:hypothetical protein
LWSRGLHGRLQRVGVAQPHSESLAAESAFSTRPLRPAERPRFHAGGAPRLIWNVRRHMPTRKRAKKKAAGNRWSQEVTETSNALDLEEGLFALEDPREIAKSLKRSAEASRRRKSPPFRSAMSMLTFYINRAGGHLSAEQRARLEKAKDELRLLYGRPRQVHVRREDRHG